MFDGESSHNRNEYKVSRARTESGSASSTLSSASDVPVEAVVSASKGSIPDFSSKDKPSSRNDFLIPACIKHILNSLEEGYEFNKPVRVAVTKFKNCLENTISYYQDWYVDVDIHVNDGEYTIFITDLSAGRPHKTAVQEAAGQFGHWRNSNGFEDDFDLDSDATQYWNDNVIRCPDVVISQAPAPFLRRVVVEVEHGNRGTLRMREEYPLVFNDPNVKGLVAIKIFEETRCAALLYERDAVGGIAVVTGLDIGLLELTTQTKNFFAQALTPTDLPAFPINQWLRYGTANHATITPILPGPYAQWHDQPPAIVGVPNLPVIRINDNRLLRGGAVDDVHNWELNVGKVYFRAYSKFVA